MQTGTPGQFRQPERTNREDSYGLPLLPRLRPRQGWAKLLLFMLAPSLAVAAALELLVFRYILVATDVPVHAYDDGVVKFEPGQTGLVRRRGRAPVRFNINRNGWNSAHALYPEQRRPGVQRIAVVGDSFVHALSVDVEQSIAERLESLLGRDTNEVFRFGMPAAPMSHYLHVVREEVVPLRPDVLVVVLVHNDFTDSYLPRPGGYTESLMMLDLSGDSVREIPPVRFERPWYYTLRRSATYRFLVDTYGVGIQRLKDLVNGRALAASSRYEANVDVSRLYERLDHDRRVVDYVLAELVRLSGEHGFEVVVAIDGVRHGLYRGLRPEEIERSRAYQLNRVTADAAKRHGLPLVDLHATFERDYRRNAVRFNPVNDGHWNAYAHFLAARAVYEHLTRHQAQEGR